MRNAIRFGALLAMMLGAVFTFAQYPPQQAFAARCGKKPDARPRLFATTNGKRWEEYLTLEDEPDTKGGAAQTAALFDAGANRYVVTQSEGPDYWLVRDYCFAPDGKLIGWRTDLDRDESWTYVAVAWSSEGVLKVESEGYYDIEKKLNDLPADAAQFKALTAPKLYDSFQELPFADLPKEPESSK